MAKRRNNRLDCYINWEQTPYDYHLFKLALRAKKAGLLAGVAVNRINRRTTIKNKTKGQFKDIASFEDLRQAQRSQNRH